MNIYFDIETIPSQIPATLEQIKADAEEAKANIRVPATHKKPETIESYLSEKKEEIDAGIDATYCKTSLDGTHGQIAVIGMAIDDGEPMVFWDEDFCNDYSNEASVIEQAFSIIERRFKSSRMTRPVFIGHNIIGFDLPFLWKRCVITGIRPPAFIPFKAKAWDATVFDTMSEWAGFGKTISQDSLSKALGYPGKGDIDGSKVWDYVKAGRIEEVAEYCKQDVEAVRRNFKRMTFQGI